MSRVRLPPVQRVRAPIDHAGAAVLTTAVLALTLVAGWGGTAYPWASPQVLVPAAVGALALVAFVPVERRAAEPVIPPRLFGDRDFALAQILSLLAGAVMLSVVNYLPQYMQYVQQASPTASGMLLLPLMLGMLAAQLLTGHLAGRTGRHRIYPILGGALMTAGLLVLLSLDAGTGTATASALTLLAGIGIGLVVQSTLLITIDSADPRDMGAASGTVTLLRTIGGSLGIALLGALYAAETRTDLADRLGPEQATRLSEVTPAALDGLSAPARAAVRTAVTSGLHAVLLGATALSALVFAATWLLRADPLRTDPLRTDPRPPSPARAGKV